MVLKSQATVFELVVHNILITGLGPGVVAASIDLSTMQDPAKTSQLDRALPLGRMTRPREIGSVVALLADRASDITVTTVFANGGLRQSSPCL